MLSSFHSQIYDGEIELGQNLERSFTGCTEAANPIRIITES